MKDFEKKLATLEGICEQLRSGGIGLDESLQQFEAGVVIYRELESYLKKAGNKVEVLLNDFTDKDSEPAVSLFVDTQDTQESDRDSAEG